LLSGDNNTTPILLHRDLPGLCGLEIYDLLPDLRPYGETVTETDPLIGPPQAPDQRDWIALSGAPLPVDAALSWVARPDCGGVVIFCGTVRDFSDGRSGVTSLEYEVYPEEAVDRLAQVADSTRRQWPMVGRLAMLHRVGHLVVGETSVVVAASTPHRAEAFDAARYCIDTLKQTVPIWKRETWEGGTDWSVCSHDAEDLPA
jgi:molybdopterin synthase catalytic subunit